MRAPGMRRGTVSSSTVLVDVAIDVNEPNPPDLPGREGRHPRFLASAVEVDGRIARARPVLGLALEAVEAEEMPLGRGPRQMVDGRALEHAELKRQPRWRLLQGVSEKIELVADVERIGHARGDKIG